MNKDEFASTIGKYCRELSISPDAISHPIDFVQMIETLYQISSKQISNFYFFVPHISQIMDLVPEFLNIESQLINDSINILLDSSISIEKRKTIAQPLLALIPFLKLEKEHQIVQGILELMKICSKEIISYLDNVEVSCFRLELFTDILNILKSIDPQIDVSPVTFFAPFANVFIEALPESLDFVQEIFGKYLKGEKNHLIAAYFLAERMSSTFGNKPDCPIPGDLFESLIDHIIDDDLEIRQHANKALRRLIESGVYDNPTYPDSIVQKFSLFSEDTYKIFFKLLNKFFEDPEMVDIDTIKPIFTFMISILKQNDKPILQGYALTLVTLMATANKMFLSELYQSCIQLSHIFLEQKLTPNYLSIANIFLAIEKSFGLDKISNDDVKLLANSISDESLSIKQKIKISEALISIMLDDTANYTDQINQILSFVKNSYNDFQGNLVYHANTILISCRKLIHEEASDLVSKLIERCKIETNNDRLNATLETIKKLSKKCKVDQIVDFVNILMNGEIEFLGGMKPFVAVDEKSMLLDFIAYLISKFPNELKHVCNEISSWIGYVPPTLISLLLETVATGIEHNLLSDEVKLNILNTLSQNVEGFDISDPSFDNIVMTTNVISKLFIQKPNTEFALALIPKLDKLTQTNEEEDEETNSESLAAIIKLIVELIPFTDTINVENLLDLIELLPFPTQSKTMDEILVALSKLIQNKEKIGDAYVPILKLFTMFVVMKKDVLNQYILDQDRINQLKVILKGAITENRLLEKELTSDFKKDRQKLNRFNSIYKA